MLPGVAGRQGVSGGLLGVAKVVENSGLVVAVADFSEQGEGLLVATDGILVVAEVVVRVAEVVERVCLAAPVTILPEIGECLLAGIQGMLILAEQGVSPGYVTKGVSLPCTTAGGTVQRVCLQGVAKRSFVVALILVSPDQPAMSVGLANLVAEFTEHNQGLPQVDACLAVAAEPAVADSESFVRMSFALPVSVIPRGIQGDFLDGGQVVPAPSPVEVIHQRPGELPGVGGLVRCRRLA